MDPNAKCHGCYDTTTPVRCSGKILKGKKIDQDEELTAAGCIKSNGQCCDPFLTDDFRKLFNFLLFKKSENKY